MLFIRNIAKSILLFTNILFILLGIVLISLGVYLNVSPDLSNFSGSSLSNALITSGILILLIALLGCCGAEKENRLFLFPYCILVIISLIAQIGIVGFMYRMHYSLLNISKNENYYSTATLTPEYKIIKWIEKRFYYAYDLCDPIKNTININNNDKINMICRNSDNQWFIDFTTKLCINYTTYNTNDTNPILKKDTANSFNQSTNTKENLFYNCEKQMIYWISTQGDFIGMICFFISLFELLLVLLCFYIMCNQRQRRKGYEEIHMPLKEYHSLSPHIHQKDIKKKSPLYYLNVYNNDSI